MSNIKNISFSVLSASFFICMLLTACQKKEQAKTTLSGSEYIALYDSIGNNCESYPDTVEIKYAKGLKVEYKADGAYVSICNPDAKSHKKSADELFIPKGKTYHRFICTTALQLGNFEALGLEEDIIAINSLKNIFSEKIKSQIESGKTVKIGKEGNFDQEAVIATKADFIFVSASKHGGFEGLKDCGIPLISHHGYKETNPLGHAEWIKLIGLLTGQTKRANAIFANIEKEYLALSAKIDSMKTSGKTLPTVMSGRQLRDGWYVMGGNSYMAQLFSDAGAQYIMKDVDETGGTTLDFEAAYAKGINADFWQTDGSFDSEFTLADLAAEDDRYADMKAYKDKKVVFCNLTMTPYRELAAVTPQLMLADFIHAFHPELLPDYQPRYYKIIK